MTMHTTRHSASSRSVAASRATLGILILILGHPVWGHSSSPVLTAGLPTPVIQEGQDAVTLEPGKPVKRELAQGQRQTYRIRLGANQFLKAIVEQQGIDVVVQAATADGKQILEFNSEIRLQGAESISLVAAEAGDYRLIVRPAQQEAAGSYEIRVEELREATETDRALQEARRLQAESTNLYRAGKYDEAVPLAVRGLEIREKILGPEHPDVAGALHALAIIYLDNGEYAKAEPLYRRALDIRKRVLSPEHLALAASFNSLANLSADLGDNMRAEPLYRQAQAIWEKALGPEDYNVSIALNNLAIIYQELGDYAKAEPFFQRSLSIKQKTLGPEHPDVAQSLNNVADFYYRKGDFVQAESMFRRALEMREKLLGPNHPDVAQSLNNLANLYNSLGEFAKAEPLYRRTVKIREQVFGPEHRELGVALTGLANLGRNQGRYAEAEPLYRRAVAIREKALGPDHQEVANSLYNFATLYLKIGDYPKAESLFQRALTIFEKSLGPESPEVAEVADGLAALYAANGDLARAVAFRSRSNAVIEHNLRLNLTIGSERQKLAYLNLFLDQTNSTISLHARTAPDDPEALKLVLTTLLQRKGRGLDVVTDAIAPIRRRANEQDLALLNQLSSLRSQLAVVTLRGPGAAGYDAYRSQVTALTERVEVVEGEISARSAEFRAQTRPVTLTAVQAAIPAEAALVEFALYTPSDPKTRTEGPSRYIAYLLVSQGQPKWVDLGAAVTIDRGVAALRQALRNPGRANVKQVARALDEKVMRPVRALLQSDAGEKRRILISPDGALNLIPFAALVDERNRYLVTNYEFSYLTSGRDLLRLQLHQPSRQGPLVVADPDFGRLAIAKKDEDGSSPGAQPPLTASAIRPRLYFRPLPGTADEAQALGSILPEVTLLMKSQATETALKQVKGPGILHIATHGFFLKDLDTGLPGVRGLGLPKGLATVSDALSRLHDLQLEPPLLRSGLALAGANEHQGGNDDGVLTALEAADLDLWGTKLVVLSACDTGVGDVKNGDGVYGLRRALVLAGSESQVMSLWPVSDLGARDLMIEYYRALQQGAGRSAALRQVQLQMLQSKSRRHPFYWASFIQSGEWGNLQDKR